MDEKRRIHLRKIQKDSGELYQGVLKLDIIRGEFAKTGENIFGSKANPYVVVYYPSLKDDDRGIDRTYFSFHKGKPAYKGGVNPSFNWSISINLLRGHYMLGFEVLDKNDMRIALHRDRLLLHKEVDMREWIANKRFEKKIDLYDAYDVPAKLTQSDGNVTVDGIQVAAKVTYTLIDQVDNTSGRGLHSQDSIHRAERAAAISPAINPPKSDASPRTRPKLEGLMNPDEKGSSMQMHRPSISSSTDYGEVPFSFSLT